MVQKTDGEIRKITDELMELIPGGDNPKRIVLERIRNEGVWALGREIFCWIYCARMKMQDLPENALEKFSALFDRFCRATGYTEANFKKGGSREPRKKRTQPPGNRSGRPDGGHRERC